MIIVAADAKSQTVKDWIEEYLKQAGHGYINVGPASEDDAQDITEFIPEVAKQLRAAIPMAIAVCGNGIGVTICLNRFKGVRAGLATTAEMAGWAREYDDCNALCLAAWQHTDKQSVWQILDAWFAAKFEPIPRRVARIQAMNNLG